MRTIPRPALKNPLDIFFGLFYVGRAQGAEGAEGEVPFSLLRFVRGCIRCDAQVPHQPPFSIHWRYLVMF